MDFAKAQSILKKLDEISKPFGFKTHFAHDVRQEPWAKFPTHSWTWGLVPLEKQPWDGTDIGELVGPTFTCSHKRLPGPHGKKFREFRSWASSTAAFLRNGDGN